MTANEEYWEKKKKEAYAFYELRDCFVQFIKGVRAYAAVFDYQCSGLLVTRDLLALADQADKVLGDTMRSCLKEPQP